MTLEKTKIGNIIPTDVSIFYEGGVPFLKYTGTTYIGGRKAEVFIPKMDLCLREINTHLEVKYEENNDITYPVTCRQNVYIVNDTFFSVRFIDESLLCNERSFYKRRDREYD